METLPRAFSKWMRAAFSVRCRQVRRASSLEKRVSPIPRLPIAWCEIIDQLANSLADVLLLQQFCRTEGSCTNCCEMASTMISVLGARSRSSLTLGKLSGSPSRTASMASRSV